MKATRRPNHETASAKITHRIQELSDWRGATLAHVRQLILEADPDIAMEEEWKWAKAKSPGIPVWSHDGIVCTGETYKHVVKLTFARGASIKDPKELFNSSLEGKMRRAIDLCEGEKINEAAFKQLIRAAVATNSAARAQPKAGHQAKPVKLLSGGNPQIAKADGDAPVQAYIAAMPGWKRLVGGRLDALIVRSVPNVRKAVKWNSPFYGIEGKAWFLAVHTFTHYVRVTFFRGTSLRPIPPGASKSKETRYVDIGESDKPDEAQMATWVKQAAALPGWAP